MVMGRVTPQTRTGVAHIAHIMGSAPDNEAGEAFGWENCDYQDHTGSNAMTETGSSFLYYNQTRDDEGVHLLILE